MAKKLTECHSCNFVTECDKFKGGMPSKEFEVELCKLCADSPASNAVFYPDQYPDSRILSTILYVGNHILKALR